MIEIIPVEYGKSTLSESLIFQGGRDDVALDIVFKVYIIKSEDKLILVDAGCETMPGFEMRDFIGTVEALKRINISCEDITDCIITHSHHDHIECVKYFENAVIHIEKNEYDSGKGYIPKGFKLNIFEKEFALSENVKVLRIGGHTKGSCIVEASVAGKIYVIAGDECYLRECLRQKIPTGSSTDEKASKDFIEKYSDAKYEVLLCHDE